MSRISRALVAPIGLLLLLAGAACGADDEDLGTGKCRFVSATEMAEATGLPEVKPVETHGGCSYLYDPDAVVPAMYTDLKAIGKDYEPMPPAISFQFDGPGAADWPAGGGTPVENVGDSAFWTESEHALVVRSAEGTARISVEQAGLPRTDDLTRIAVKAYGFGAGRLKDAAGG
ncbi:hypothetical protein [Paractinoplanes atraurantiacus]|uniref:DUF3558 domain-containing protein n=1 Tax=Paractinoplanes atraurantiacus TaxID=1036182 RepID=A0A285I7Y6_9ACTN|nr:hypothetical protein [Actinoplanes atraurantiacus]SNY44089.1 hypothetical protein SAMN05421748_10727 [Actinoplanes atraurantiacus]